MDFLKGTVYSKALAIFLAAALALLGSVVALSQFVILRELAGSEQREMRSMLQRFSHVMSREARPLETAASEWARSLSGQSGSASLEVTPENLRRLSMDFAVVFSASGRPERVVLASGAEDVLERNASFFEKMGQEIRGGDRTEYFVLGDHLGLVAIAQSAAQENVSGESGTVVAGKIFRRDSWGFFEGLFSAVVKFHLFESGDFSEPKRKHLLDLLATQDVVVDAGREDQIVGFTLISGFDKRPLGYVTISQPRPLRQEGLRAIQVFLTGICLAGGGLVLVVWVLLDRTILARIKDLTRKLDTEKKHGRLPVKLDFHGEDELGTLARGIEDLAVLLERTQSLHSAVLEDQTELICRFDTDFRLTFANIPFLRFADLPELSLSSDLRAIIPREAWKSVEAHFGKLSRDTPLVSFTQEIWVPSGGRSSWFRSTLRRNFSPDGETVGGQWVLVDITAQVSAQRKMIESERRFRRLFESASEGLLLLEGESLVVSDINPSLCRMLMVAGTEVLGRPLDQLPVFSPCLGGVKEFRRLGGEKGARLRSECRLSRSDETSVFVEMRCGGYDADGVAYIQLSIRNISERVLGERELRRLSVKLLRLQDEERRRIARELHDSTAQNLSALEMNMSLLEPLVDGSHPRAARIVADTRQIAAECSKELRNIAYLLHPPLIDEVGLVFAIKWFVDGFSKRTGIATTLEIEEGFPRLISELEMPLFRVVQEAMTNVYRHSGADRAWVRLRCADRLVTMEIRDNGRGFAEGVLAGEGGEQELLTGVGLAGMRERLANFGGTLEIESSPLGATLFIRVALGTEEVLSDGLEKGTSR